MCIKKKAQKVPDLLNLIICNDLIEEFIHSHIFCICYAYYASTATVLPLISDVIGLFKFKNC